MSMILAIDPSIANLGWAILTYEPGTDAHPRIECSGTVKRKTSNLSPEHRINSILEGLEDEIVNWFCRATNGTIVIEQPQLWGSYKSTASLHSGALLGLHILTGALYWWGTTHVKEVHLIPVTEWKGQLPKSVTRKRMEKKYDVKFETFDESDAVGLGDYFIGTMTKCPI